MDKDGCIKEHICEFHKNIMYIDRIYIEEKYRNIGIASFVIESISELLEYTVNLNPHTLILLPKPQQKNGEGELCNIKDKEEKVNEFKFVLKNLDLFAARGTNGVKAALSTFKQISYEKKRSLILKITDKIIVKLTPEEIDITE